MIITLHLKDIMRKINPDYYYFLPLPLLLYFSKKNKKIRIAPTMRILEIVFILILNAFQLFLHLIATLLSVFKALIKEVCQRQDDHD